MDTRYGVRRDQAVIEIAPLLHLCDSLFPIGAFAYSEGLEAATTGGAVTTAEDLRQWLDVCLDEGIGRSDGPAMAIAWRAFAEQRWDVVAALDQALVAMRPAATARQSIRSLGIRLVRTWQQLHPHRGLAAVIERAHAGADGPTLPVAFAVACASTGIDPETAIEAFAYTRLAGTISCAMRLMAIGQMEAHALLADVLARVPCLVADVLARDGEPESFAPALDLAVMSQAHVHSRLFRS
jgi:urease accessory protein